MQRRFAQVALASVALVAMTGAGRVVRVDAPRVREVRIAAGWFELGVPAEQANDAYDRCTTATPSLGIVNGAVIEFCELYRAQLTAMLPRQVYLSAYRIDRDEVTVEDYRACIAAGSCVLDPMIAGDERYLVDGAPMVNITWREAGAYCRWRGGRLPTEAEWERAARGVDVTAVWPWGAVERPDDFNHGKPRADAMRQIHRDPFEPSKFFGDPDPSDGHAYAAPPGSYPWGESTAGTRDQAGNVAEWTADALGTKESDVGYAGLESLNPRREGDASATRIVRGGSWRQPAYLGQSNLRDPFAELYEPDRRFSHVGFRCARTDR